MLAGNAAYDPAATWLISRTTLTSTTSTINFTGITSGYQHLQLRYIARDAGAGTADAAITFRVGNGTPDSGSNYAYHYLEGNGSSASATGSATQTSTLLAGACVEGATTASIFAAGIIDIHDYASTTKNKTIRTFHGNDRNGSGRMLLESGLWMSTSAIDYIRITKTGTGFASGSTFALYGYK
jgi:hypothetical protein